MALMEVNDYGATNMGHSHQHDHSSGEKDPCCQTPNQNNGQRMPTIFDVIKTGMLVPTQTIVETLGVEVLKTRDEKGHTPAHWACLGGHVTLLRYMMEMKAPIDEPSDNDLGQHPIHWACVNGHVAVVDILLQSGVPIDIADSKGCTPLIVACQYGRTMLAGYLIGKSARIHLTDKDGDTALHWAAFKGQNELMRLLIYAGLSAHQKDNYHQTAMHLSCINGNLTSVRELLEIDQCDLDQPDKNGKTPLMLAMGRKHDHVIAYLKKEIANKKRLIPKVDLWSIVFGPPGNSKGPLVFFLVNVLFWGYPMYFFKCLPLTWYQLETVHVIFLVGNLVMWICLYHANTADPGFLPQNTPEYDQAIKSVARFDEWKQGVNPLSRLCHTCRTVKPLRSKHCRVCNRCIEQFDHHCPYIYNCVGVNNRAWFFFFLCSCSVNGVCTIYFCLTMLRLAGMSWLIFLGFVESLFFTCVALFLINCMLYQAVANITTNERINKDRYEYLKDGRGKFYNPFNRGIKNNIMEFLHMKRPLREDEVKLLNVMVV